MNRQRAASLVLMIFAFGCGSGSELATNDDDFSFSQKPQITITQPAQGAFVATNSSGLVSVAGTTRGSSLTINGQAVSVDSKGNFKAQVKAAPGMNVIDAHVNSIWGGEAQRAFLYGDFAAPNATIPSGVEIRSTAKAYDDHSPALDNYSSIARAILAQTDFSKYIGGIAPVTYDFGIGSVDVYVTSIDFNRNATVLDLSPKAVGAHGNGSFDTFVTGLHLVLHFFGDHGFDATATVDHVAFDGDFNLKYSPTAQVPDPNNPGHLITGPGIVGSADAPALQLGNLTINTSISFPGVDTFITWLANHFRGVIASTVSQEIQANAANHFAAQLNQFGLPAEFDLTPFGVNAKLYAGEDFDPSTSFDDNGSTVSAATRFSWPQLNPGAPGLGTPGSFKMGAKPAASFPASTVAISVAFDALNQGVYSVWGQGALARQVYPAKSFSIFRLDPVVATPMLPPVLVPTADGKVHAVLGDIVVTTAVHAGLLFDGNIKVTLSAGADVALDVDPANGALRFTLSGKPQIWLDINNLLGIVPDALLAPLSAALQAIAPTIAANVIKPIEVPLPAIPLSTLIQGSTAKLHLGAPVNVAVDPATLRVTVSGDLAVTQ